MKKLHKLDEALITFAGNPVTYQESIAADPKPLTRKIAILNCLGSMQTENGLGSIRVYMLGTQLYKVEVDDACDLSDDDLGLLKIAVEQNKPGYVPLIQGQLLEYLGA